MNKAEQLLPLKDIYLPGEPSIFPLAIGWWIVIIACILILALILFFIYQRHIKKSRYDALLMQWNEIKNNYQNQQNLHLLAQSSSEFMHRLVRHKLNDIPASCLYGKDWYNYLFNLISDFSISRKLALPLKSSKLSKLDGKTKSYQSDKIKPSVALDNLESLNEVIINGPYDPNINYDCEKLFNLVEYIIYQVSKK